jgi:peroxiredoxin
MAIKKRLDQNKGNKDSTAILNKQLEGVDKKVKDYKLDFINKNPDSFISRIFISSKDPDVPKTPILPNGRKDSVFEYNAFKDHYWDNIDFSDERIIRTPVFYNRINNFFTNVVIQHPDSICKEADKLVEKARASKEMFKYVVWWITYTYETSKIIGFDAIFVHMVETYYMSNQCYWLSPTLLENITKRAMKLKPLLLGKVAPHMVMQDTNLQLQSLEAVVAKYTIVLFWDYNCGHCKTEMPKIVDYYNKKKEELSIKVFAVCTDTSMIEMKKFIRKNQMNFINVNGPRAITPHYSELYDIYSTPVIYLLGDKKIIISKRIEADQIDGIIKHDIKMKALQKK